MKKICSIPGYICIIILLGVISGVSPLFSAEKEPVIHDVLSMGTGMVCPETKKDEEDDAEDAGAVQPAKLAVEDALSGAVSSILIRILTPEEISEHMQILHNALLADSEKFILKYKVLKTLETKNITRVLVEASVQEKTIKDELMRLGILQDMEKLPRVLILLAEKNVAELSFSFWWSDIPGEEEPLAEKALEEALTGKGFSVVSHGPVLPPSMSERIYTADLEGYEAIEIGKAMNAEVVIIGQADARYSYNTLEDTIKSFTATVSAIAFWVDTGEEITSTTQEATSVNPDEKAGGIAALVAAGKAAGEKLAMEIARAHRNKLRSAQTYKLIIGGTGNLGNFVMFRKGLNSLDGVRSIHILEMRTNEASLEVEYEKSARELSETLLRMNYPGFGIRLYEVLPNLLRIELVPK